MTQTLFTIGASASCTDGACGQVIRVVVNPVGRVITHLVVGPRHEHGKHLDRLVPVDLAEVTADGIRLNCTKAKFDALDPAEETNFTAGGEHPDYEPDQVLCLPYYGLSGVWTEGQGWDRGEATARAGGRSPMIQCPLARYRCAAVNTSMPPTGRSGWLKASLSTRMTTR